MENTEGLLILIQLAIPLAFLLAAYLIGQRMEKNHLKALDRRERQTRDVPAITLNHLPASWGAQHSALVTGSVVISVDYFKRFLATLRLLFGGELKAYVPLLTRARREAILRMKEQAIAEGFDGIFNVRIETSRLASGGGDNKRTAGVRSRSLRGAP